MSKLKIGLVFGGRSGEHEVSKVSAQAVSVALTQAGFSVVPIFIAKNGRWSVKKKPVVLPPVPGVGLRVEKTGRPIKIDVFFPVLHGTFGEDGTIQGLLEMAEVPYVGAGVLGSAIGMDKEAQKLLFNHHGIPTPHFDVVHLFDWERDQDECLRRASRIGFPLFVKPANLGSSVGVSKVGTATKLKRAIKEAFRFDTKVLIEEAILGREVFCGVIGNDAPRVSLPGEVIPKAEFYDYVAKYVSDETEYKVPIPLARTLQEKVMRLAVELYPAAFCQGMARVDFFLTPGDELTVIEINTIPGFTGHSLFPRIWEASGLSFPALVQTLVELAKERWRRERRLAREFKEGRLLDRGHKKS